MSGKTWHAESTVPEMREAIRSDFRIFGSCIVDPLHYLGHSGGVYLFASGTDEEGILFRITAGLDYTAEPRKAIRSRRLPLGEK